MEFKLVHFMYFNLSWENTLTEQHEVQLFPGFSKWTCAVQTRFSGSSVFWATVGDRWVWRKRAVTHGLLTELGASAPNPELLRSAVLYKQFQANFILWCKMFLMMKMYFLNLNRCAIIHVQKEYRQSHIRPKRKINHSDNIWSQSWLHRSFRFCL